MTCFRCPYTQLQQCEGPCGVCPDGTCVGEMDGSDSLVFDEDMSCPIIDDDNEEVFPV